ncbi:MAG: hypothetical protein HGA19_11770, partial [Oscillochloris sp.]|nr:hypothetical protein [Oscillochloris sp.]
QVLGSVFIADAGLVPYFGASLELSGSKAYVVTKNGLDVFDISKPANLTLQTPAPSYAFPAALGPALGGRVTIANNHAYVTVYRDTANSASKGGITVFNLGTTQCSAIPAVQTAAGTPLSIEVQGNLAYVGEWATSLNGATNPGALHVFNVADPCSPQLLWSTPTTVSGNNELHDLVVRDGVAYLANDSNGLVRYKVTEPAKPTFLDQRLNDGTYTHAIFYDGGRYAYVSQIYSPGHELAIYDMTTFPNAAPTYYAPTFSGHRDIHDVQVLNGRAYLLAADGYGGNHFQILDVSTPTAPSLLGDLALPCSQYGDVGDIRIQGSVAYVATSPGCYSGTHEGGLLAINVSTPASPQVLGSVFIADAGLVPYFGASLELSGSKAYVVTKNGLDVFDISNPANLTLQTPAPRYAFPAALGPALGGHVTIKDNRAYVTVYRDTANSASKGGMTVFDLDSTTPNPAPYRDVGKVRIWADSFQTVNGQTTASGNIGIGPQSDLAYYRVGTTASWSGSGPLTVTGNLQIAEGPTFATGIFTVDTTSGALTWGAGSRATLSKLGDSNLAITPTITVNVLQPTMQVAATVTLNLPENTGKTLPVSYKVGVKGVISDGQPANLSMKLAGGTLNATVTPTQQGLVAASAQYTLPGLAALALPSVKIDAKGYAGLSIGSGDSFAMPNIDLGRGVFVLNGLQGSLMVSGSAYVINLSGGLSINHLPGMRTALTPAASNLRIAQGVVSGSVADFKLGIGGSVVNFTGVTIQHTTDYRLMAANAIWTWPAAWGGGTTTLKNVALTTTAPFIEISGSQGFTSDKVFALAGGNATKITFDKVHATIAYTEKPVQWNVTINARVTFALGSDSTSINAATFTLQDGVVRGSLGAQKLKIAGLTLTTSSLSFDTTAFKSDSASLQLPATWGESVATLKGLTISASGITLGSSSNAFAIPDVTLGAAAMLKLSAVQGTLVMDKTGDYSIAVSAKLTINKVLSLNGDSLVVPANLTIKRGRVDGSVSNLAFKLSGVNISAASMTFIDNKLTAEQAKLTLPIAGSEVSTTIYGLELGGDAGLKLQSARVALPDFKIGTVGVRSVIIEFKTEADGSYGVIGAAKFAFTQFAVDGTFKIGYAASSGTALQSVTLDFKGAIPVTAIPLGNTGLYITKISGSFDLNDGSANITLQLGAASELAVGNTPVLEINGAVNIQIKPKFQLDSNANVKVIGIDVTNVQLQMTDTSFTLKGTAKISLIRASLELTFGKDASGQFTFYGNMKADVVVPKGYILNGRWIKIPAHDTTLASTTLEGGKFKQGSNVIWGARGSFKFLGVKVYTWAKLGPGDPEYGLGERLQSYTPVRPASASMASAGLASAGDPYVVAVTKPAEYLMLAEEITTTNRLAPQDIMISGPQGVTFTRQLTYEETDGSARLYRLDFSNPQDAVGQWSLVTQVGNQLTMMGAAVPPQVQSFTACASTASCLTPGQTLALSNGQNLALAWSASAATSGMTLDIYVLGTDGLHQLITHQD